MQLRLLLKFLRKLCLALCKELNINVITLHQRASKVLNYILYNYALFDIVTIDKFNHRLIKTFAYDLKIPSNFEVALDTEPLLEEAVDNLVYKAGSDEVLTKLLVDLAIEKADDDKKLGYCYRFKKNSTIIT